VWRVCEPDELLAQARRHAEILAAQPISSLIAVKQTMVEPTRAAITAAHAREQQYFVDLVGSGVNAEALAAFVDRRGPGD
jgi:enoyl-CoA hydratase/carnithine racemase